MNTTLPNLACHANALIEARFDRYVSEVRTLLAKVERRGWTKEISEVRAELLRINERASIPESFSTFHELYRLQFTLRRDVSVIERAAGIRSQRRSAAPFSTSLITVRTAPSLSASTC